VSDRPRAGKPYVFKSAGRWAWLCTSHSAGPVFETWGRSATIRDPWLIAVLMASLHAARCHIPGEQVEEVR